MKILVPKKSIPEEEEEAPSQEQVQERADQEYCAWKDWKERHDKEEKEKVERLRKSKKKDDSRSLYRECTKILKENHTRWMERTGDEERKKLEQEKQDTCSLVFDCHQLLLFWRGLISQLCCAQSLLDFVQ